jgi:hypothetical protein
MIRSNLLNPEEYSYLFSLKGEDGQLLLIITSYDDIYGKEYGHGVIHTIQFQKTIRQSLGHILVSNDLKGSYNMDCQQRCL